MYAKGPNPFEANKPIEPPTIATNAIVKIATLLPSI